MKVLIYTGKGGCGKSSISSVLNQIIPDSQIITNDVNNPYNLILKKEDYYLLSPSMEIPTFNDKQVNMIYDMGGFIDQRIKDFIIKAKDLLILIPFNPDIVSFQSAVSIFNEIKELSQNIIFVINRAKKGDYDLFKEQMGKMKINKGLLEVKESKMFQNIFNKQETLEDIRNNKLLNHSYKPVLKQIDNLVKELKQ